MGRVSRLAFGGGLAGATLFLAGMSMNTMAALRVDQNGGISDDVAVVYRDLSSAVPLIGRNDGLRGPPPEPAPAAR